MNSSPGGAFVFLIVVIAIGGLVVGVLAYDKVTGEKVAAARTELSGCQADLTNTESKYSDCVGERNQLQAQVTELNAEIDQLSGEKARLDAEKANLQSELASANNVLSQTRSDLAGALASDYAVNGLIALGLVILGAAIGLAIPFTLYLGGVIAVTEPK